MAETEQVVYINGHRWIRLPKNSTNAGEVYSVTKVESCGGDPVKCRSTVSSED